MTIISLLFTMYCGYYVDSKYFDDSLKQEVRVLDDMERCHRSIDWYDLHNVMGDYSKINPFMNETVYELKTSIGNFYSTYNYGTEAEILEMKCRVAKECLAEYNQIELDKIAYEKAEIKRDSLNEVVLERLNEKSCN